MFRGALASQARRLLPHPTCDTPPPPIPAARMVRWGETLSVWRHLQRFAARASTNGKLSARASVLAAERSRCKASHHPLHLGQNTAGRRSAPSPAAVPRPQQPLRPLECGTVHREAHGGRRQSRGASAGPLASAHCVVRLFGASNGARLAASRQLNATARRGAGAGGHGQERRPADAARSGDRRTRPGTKDWRRKFGTLRNGDRNRR